MVLAKVMILVVILVADCSSSTSYLQELQKGLGYAYRLS